MVRIDTISARPGDALMEDLQEKVGIPRGTILDHVLIRRISGAGVQTIAVERPREGGDATDHAEVISENIELALRRRGTEQDAIQLSEQEIKNVQEVVRHAEESIRYIEEIESGEKTASRDLNVRLEGRIGGLVNIFRDMLEEERFNLTYLESLIEQIIRDTGANRDTSLLLMHLRRDAEDYLATHSLNVCLIALATGIELSKMMEKKIREPAARADPKLMAVSNTKILGRGELVQLGLSALLHDLALKQSFPDLHVAYHMRPGEVGKFQRHPSETFHLLKKLNVDFEIAKAALQHHERMDGKGYPDGMEGRFLSVCARIIGFADRYELLISRNPFQKRMLPRNALMHILRNERTQFDPDVMLSFVHASSSFPVGSWIMLEDGSIGYVVEVNPRDYQKPFVRLVYDPSVTALARKSTVDLCEDGRKIRDLVDSESLRVFDPGLERYFMDGREFERIEIELPVHMRGPREQTSREGKTVDVSVGGMRVSIVGRFELGDTVTVEFTLPDGKSYAGVSAAVMWKKLCTDGSSLLGIAFREVSAATHREFHDFITTHLRARSRKAAADAGRALSGA
jgi:HD-GYP domain-containing protein (c-di-GMP phosphodiesterase class II)